MKADPERYYKRHVKQHENLYQIPCLSKLHGCPTTIGPEEALPIDCSNLDELLASHINSAG
jgi:hypothetical protein